MDRLTATRVFVAVVEQGSLTQAAEHLDMSTAMVSRYLVAMEDWLGARLLHRTTRRIGLTEAGVSALSSCRQLLDLAEDVQHQAGSASRVAAGKLRVACSPSFAEAQLAGALVQFQAQHPQVSFSVLTADRSVDLTAERIDLAVRITNSLDPALIARSLAVCRSVLCATPQYLAEHSPIESLQDLRSHRCLSHAFVSATQYRFRRGASCLRCRWMHAFPQTRRRFCDAPCWRVVGWRFCPRTSWGKICAWAGWSACFQSLSQSRWGCTLCTCRASTSHWRCGCWWAFWRSGLVAIRRPGTGAETSETASEAVARRRVPHDGDRGDLPL